MADEEKYTLEDRVKDLGASLEYIGAIFAALGAKFGLDQIQDFGVKASLIAHCVQHGPHKNQQAILRMAASQLGVAEEKIAAMFEAKVPSKQIVEIVKQEKNNGGN